MVRAGFTLVEVIASLAVLAAAALGLAGTAVVAQRTLRAAELQEQAVRHAAALLDSLTFTDGAGSDSLSIGAIGLSWITHPGDAAPVHAVATYPAGGALVALAFATRRVPLPPVRRP